MGWCNREARQACLELRPSADAGEVDPPDEPELPDPATDTPIEYTVQGLEEPGGSVLLVVSSPEGVQETRLSLDVNGTFATEAACTNCPWPTGRFPLDAHYRVLEISHPSDSQQRCRTEPELLAFASVEAPLMIDCGGTPIRYSVEGPRRHGWRPDRQPLGDRGGGDQRAARRERLVHHRSASVRRRVPVPHGPLPARPRFVVLLVERGNSRRSVVSALSIARPIFFVCVHGRDAWDSARPSDDRPTAARVGRSARRSRLRIAR